VELLVGIDPGHDGGICLFEGGELVKTFTWSGKKWAGYCDALQEVWSCVPMDRTATVILEVPVNKGRKGWRTWLSQGRYWGSTEKFCRLNGWKLVTVHPSTWKTLLRKHIGTTDKAAAMTLAQMNHDGLADAYCMVRWWEESNAG
jgi:hypothetical protein